MSTTTDIPARFSSMPRIEVYGPVTCTKCFMTIQHFAKHGAEAVKVNIAPGDEGHTRVTGLGYREAPVVMVTTEGGAIHWGGFRPDMIQAVAQAVRATAERDVMVPAA